MINTADILETIHMIREENLDIRTVTMGISLYDCVSDDIDRLCANVYDKIMSSAKNLVSCCEGIEKLYGIPIVNKRVSVTPISQIGGAATPEGYVKLAKTLDRAAHDLGINFIGGFSALVQKGMTKGADRLIDAIPEALAVTDMVCSSVNVGSTRAGINMDAVARMGRTVKAAAELTRDRDAIGCAKATRQLLSLPQRPTAILFPDDFSAIGGVQAIREEGLLIPRDISVAGYDGNLISQVMSPQLTTYRQDTEAMGKPAAELLIEEIESPRTALPEQRLIAGSFARGESIDTPHR